MKIKLNIRSIFLVVLSIFLSTATFAQKKNKVRLKASYVKIMNGEIYFDVSASSRINKRNVDVSNIDLVIQNELDDETIELGIVTTNSNGDARLTLPDISSIRPDSTNTYNILISFKGNDAFSKAKKGLNFKNASINAKLITKDSLNYISATLVDASIQEPMIDEYLTVQVQRLFKPLKIGEEFNATDENGTILVNVEEGIPGVNGILNIEVVLEDSDDFGTIKAIVEAPIGTVIVDESTFDKRTMWSPRNKTPIFLLIFPNILIFGIWGLIIYLFINLFRISKS